MRRAVAKQKPFSSACVGSKAMGNSCGDNKGVFIPSRYGDRLDCRNEAKMLDRPKVVLDKSPARDRSFRDFVLVRKHPVPPSPLK